MDHRCQIGYFVMVFSSRFLEATPQVCRKCIVIKSTKELMDAYVLKKGFGLIFVYYFKNTHFSTKDSVSYLQIIY